jgi:photosynthetic reaction center H subunit
MRIEKSFKILPSDTDPRGLEVFGLEGKVGGTCVDVWVDRSEHIIRYIEIKTLTGNSVLAPFNLSVIKKNAIFINSIMSSQFEDVPGLKNANTISLLEEEKIMGYYGAGTLMAFPRRRESAF